MTFRRTLQYALSCTLTLILLSGCKEKDSADPVPTDTHSDVITTDDVTVPAPVSPYSMSYQSDPFEVTIKRNESTIAKVTHIRMGLVEDSEFDETNFYDPHETNWHPVDFEEIEPTDFTIEETSDGTYTAQLTPQAPAGYKLVNIQIIMDAPKGEQYYGLGEYFDAVSHRGRRRPMHFEVATDMESGYNEAHIPVPLLIGTQGWGLFVEDRRPGDFDVASTNDDQIMVTYEATELKFHLLAADHPMNVPPKYVALTAKPALPAPWAFGGHLWRNENESQEQFEADLKAIRDNDLPLSVMWIDRPWQTHYNSFEMSNEKFPDPKGLVTKLRNSGFRLAFWSAPYIRDDYEAMYNKFKAVNGFVGWPLVQLFDKFGELVDLTNPEAIELFSGLIQKAVDLGAEGFKLDYAEDVQAGAFGTNIPAEFHNKESSKTMHKGYALYYHKPYADAVGGSGKGFILSRAGTYGDQAYTTTVWPGDLCNSFHRHGEDEHVGGLPAAIIGGLSLSTSGYPWFASDTGGYRHGRAPKEVLLRWTAYSALGTVMQTGGGNSYQVPWDFKEYPDGRGGTSVYDQETVDIFRKFTRLHIRLYPYKAHYNAIAHETGRAITAPLGFAHPELGEHPDFVFLLGDNLLVAPVFDATGEVTVILPEGQWFDWWTHEFVEGPKTLTRTIPLDSIALYSRAGGIIPMLRETIDTLAPATLPAVESYANDPGILTIRIYRNDQNRTFTTLGDTQINVEDGVLKITGDHFTGYRIIRIDSSGAHDPVDLQANKELTLW